MKPQIPALAARLGFSTGGCAGGVAALAAKAHLAAKGVVIDDLGGVKIRGRWATLTGFV